MISVEVSGDGLVGAVQGTSEAPPDPATGLPARFPIVANSNGRSSRGKDGSHNARETLLRFRTDRVPVALLVAYISLFAVGVRLGLYYVPLAIMIMLLRWISIIQHNHIHLPMFTRPFLNRATNVALFMATGQQQDMYTYHHIETHHRHTCSPNDWTCPSSAQWDNWPLYIWKFNLAIARRGLSNMMRSTGRRRNRFCGDLIMITLGCGTTTGLCSVAPLRLCLYLVAPWLVVATTLPLANRRQHKNCNPHDRFICANVSLGRFSTVWGFNTGYHNVHHAYPRLHWSGLKTLFEENFEKLTPASNILTTARTI